MILITSFIYPTHFSGGSLFLFDRKALRYFRKDGHNWRKKKDGKTVREAHERLKVRQKRNIFLCQTCGSKMCAVLLCGGVGLHVGACSLVFFMWNSHVDD